ncbi:hypothetical protein E2562_010311 [Oryza meyeriana var. granulata]|uniref:NAC domain-containing protein n=1 Tax=Oryza meyeriana var. granulata TaxID=110450 RepID=A0A6G1F6A3_9ORYZ|nr:hypothetical protein E2562_010311 [Oryza meyeriana var. granulata]
MAAADSQGLSPGFKFEPSDEILVQLFLLPYLRDGELPLSGLVFLDDPRSLPPWMLLDRHNRGDEDDAYFIGPAEGEGRQVRSVAGGGRWVKQRTEAKGKAVLGDETFRWEKFSLNFHRDDRRSGSTGWVMHEYVVVPPPGSAIAASYRASHIAFTGHGQNRKRVPDGYVVDPPYADTHEDQEQFLPAKEQSNQDQEQFLPAKEQSNQDQEYASTDQSNQQFLPALEQSNQQFLPAAEQSNQQFLPAAEQSNQLILPELEQSNQEYAYSEQNQCYIVPEQESNQEEYAYDQQGYFPLPLPGQSNQEFSCNQQYFTSWQEPLATSQQFLDLEQLLPEGLVGGVTISPEYGDFMDVMHMQEIIAELLGNPDCSEGGRVQPPCAYYDQPQCLLPEQGQGC